jgi:alpha-glucosidase (family GH31 glycosyl hydrolase)
MQLTQEWVLIHNRDKPSAIVGGQRHQHYRFTVLTDGLVRYEWAPDGQFEDRSSSFAVQRDQPVPRFRVKESDETLEIITSRFHLTYDKQEFGPSGLSAVVTGHTANVWRYGEASETLGGTARTLDGANGRIPLGPGLISQKGFVAIDDSASMLFGSDGFVATRLPGPGRVDGYLFAYGHDYRDAIKAFYAIAGSPPLLPRWALGNWWSRYYAYTAESYLDLMDRFRADGIPLSVAVLDMDWHLVDDPKVIEAGARGWTGYTWNKNLFPDPPAFLKELHKRKLKTTLNEHPADGIYSHEDLYDKMAKALDHDVSNKEPIPFNITNRKFMKAYFDILLQSLEDDGCDFWWIDWQQGPYSRLKGVDPLWMLNHYHFQHNARTHNRPTIFSRYAGPGSHRYPLGFSGDTIVTWDSLNFQPEFTATASNIGYGWWSHDIGGHVGGAKDEDLTTRWVQCGVFSPVMRLHSSKTQWLMKEPWNLSPQPREIVSNFLRLRHRLIPYLYTMNVRATKGEPLVQPMYWEHPYRGEAYGFRNQYLFGSEILVIPITTPQDPRLRLGNVKGWLPPGKYVDIFTGVKYTGDREVYLSRRLEQYPVLMKEGSIVPLDQALKPANGGDNPDGFEVLIVVGADGRFDVLEDDGRAKSDDIQWSRTPIKFTQDNGVAEIGPTECATVSSRNWTIRFLGLTEASPVRVFADGKEIKVKAEQTSNGLLVKLGKVSSRATATVDVGRNPQLDHNNPASLIWPLLNDAFIDYQLKENIWQIVSADSSTSTKMSRLQAMEMDANILAAVLELILADIP